MLSLPFGNSCPSRRRYGRIGYSDRSTHRTSSPTTIPGVGETATPEHGDRSERAGSRRVFVRSTVINLGLGALLLAFLLIPRLSDLDALVTPDEPLWLTRSANFSQALSSGELENTFQFAHPGVTVMALGALAFRIADPDLPKRMGGQVVSSEIRERVIPENELPIDVLVVLRRSVTIVSALVMVVLLWCLIPIIGRWPALFATVSLSLDPLHIGHTRLLHLDGLSTNLLLVTVVAYCLHLGNGSRVALVVTGVAAGLALLTRSVNGILAPLLVCLTVLHVLLAGRRLGSGRASLMLHTRRLLLGGGIAAIVVVACWPALWVAPVDTIRLLVGGGSDLASEPHVRQVLFRGDVISDDPGLVFYPLMLWYRISPVTILGLGLAGLAASLPASSGVRLNRPLCLHLVVFAVAYIAILSAAAKKLDRYLLPSLAALDLVAALGTIAMIGWVITRLRPSGARRAGVVGGLGVGLILLSQALLTRQTGPYYLTFVSPLAGGRAEARDQMSLGWGEGGKAVAEAIRAHPEIAGGEIAGGAWPRTVDYYLPFDVGRSRYTLEGGGYATLVDHRFLLVTEPEIQRQLYPSGVAAWVGTLTPLATVSDDGHVYARIFELSQPPWPPPFDVGDAPIYEWDANVALVGNVFRPRIAPGDDPLIRFLFQILDTPVDYLVDTRVVDDRCAVVGHTTKRLRVEQPTGDIVRSVSSVDLPAHLPEGSYQVQLSIRSQRTGELLSARHATTRARTDSPVLVGSFDITEGGQRTDEAQPAARSPARRVFAQ